MNHKEFSSKGGKARAKKLTKSQRAEIARTAAKKRWKGHRRGSARAQKSNEPSSATDTRSRKD